MFNILPPLLILIGLSGLIILLETTKEKEKIPEIVSFDNSEIVKKTSSFKEKFIDFNRQLFKSFLALSEKILIRLRIILLRFDRALFHSLHFLRKHKNGYQEEVKIFEIENIKDETKEEDKVFKIKSDKNKKIISEINKLEKKLLKNGEDIDILLNLARLSLFLEDNASARYYLIKAFKIDNTNKIVQDLMISVFEKDKEKTETKTEAGAE